MDGGGPQCIQDQFRSSMGILVAALNKSSLHRQYANKIFQKNACEIFHDRAVSPGFRPRVGLRVSLNPREFGVPSSRCLREMRIIRIIFILMLLACAPGLGRCAGAATTPVQTETSAQ